MFIDFILYFNIIEGPFKEETIAPNSTIVFVIKLCAERRVECSTREIFINS